VPAPHGICPAQTDTGKAGWRAVHCHSLGGGGARPCPGGLATGTPQTFPMASRDCSNTLPGSSRRNGTQRDAPHPAPIHMSRCQSQGRNNAGSSRTPFRHARRTRPIGSTGTSRLCQGCSCPPRHHPDQAALSSTAPLRRDGGEGLSPPLEMTAPHGAGLTSNSGWCALRPAVVSGAVLLPCFVRV